MTEIKQFWDWFQELEEDIHTNLESNPDHYAFLIHEQLISIHPDLVFDIPFEQQNNKHQLILSADGDASLFPLITTVVTQAPSLLHWDVYNLRPRTNQVDQAIDLDGLYLEYEDIFFTYDEVELPIQLTIYIRGYDTEDNRYVHGYFLLLDTLLGEYDAVTYTETVAIYPYDGEGHLTRFVLLRDLFDSIQQKKN